MQISTSGILQNFIPFQKKLPEHHPMAEEPHLLVGVYGQEDLADVAVDLQVLEVAPAKGGRKLLFNWTFLIFCMLLQEKIRVREKLCCNIMSINFF